MQNLKFTASVLLFFICGTPFIKAQVISAVWTKKINRQKIEVKIILNGGSITGSSWYYESPNNYLHYSIKGYFNPGTNEAVWWDDQLFEENDSGSPGDKRTVLSRSNFDFPGYGRLKLGGKTHKPDHQNGRPGEANFGNANWTNFEDEWEFEPGNFTVEAYEPATTDSIDLVVLIKKVVEAQSVKPSSEEEPIISTFVSTATPNETPKTDSSFTLMPVDSIQPSVIEQKYTTRKKVFATEIPLSGDSIELHFYDNAEIDGDSISLFLNGKLILEHIRLTDKAYSIKLAVAELGPTNELIMVAENFGFIPPNTSYMVAIVGDNRYEARLESTEGSSALIRLVKPEGDSLFRLDGQ